MSRGRFTTSSDGHAAQGNDEVTSVTSPRIQLLSQLSASTSLGPGLLNMALPSTQAARPSRTARRLLNQPFLSRCASLNVSSNVRPQGARTTKSGSAVVISSLATRKDFLLFTPMMCVPPANSTSSGVQCPPTKTGSTHSRKATDGRVPVNTVDTCLTRSLNLFVASAASCANPNATPRRFISSSTASSVKGLKLNTTGSGFIPSMAANTSVGETEHTLQRSCVSTCVGLNLLSSGPRTLYNSRPSRPAEETSASISAEVIPDGMFDAVSTGRSTMVDGKSSS
mmetsp:Transcript_58157/g.154892  ORF Transcript_58157/g.154892 Transcript_58157/m.154892 type:complete len:283 (-) Transcript_58157:106-954(-)